MMKNNFIQTINNHFEKSVEWVLDHRLIVIILCIGLCIGATALIQNLRFDFHPTTWLPDNDSSFDYYLNDFIQEYGNDEFIYIVYKSNQEIFDINTLRKTKRLVGDLKKIPYVKKVNSITNLEFIEGSKKGDLKVFNLIDELPSSSQEANSLKQKLLDKPLYLNTYISRDANHAAIFCEIEPEPKDDPYYQRKIGEALKRILSKPDYTDFKFYPVGSTIVAISTWEHLEESTIKSSFLAFTLITVLLIFLLRQFKGVIGPFVVVQVTLILILGFMSITDLPITVMFFMIPSILMAVGIADAVHIISEYQYHLKAGNDNRSSILKTVKLLGFPCLFTSITTAVGFSSLTTASISPIRDTGLAVAFGTMVAFVVTFTILVIILSFAGSKSERKFEKVEIKKNPGFMDWTLQQIAGLNNRHYKKILLISVTTILILVYGITKVEINTGYLLFFGKGIKMFNDFQYVDSTMGGTGNFEVLLHSRKADGIKDHQFIQTLEKIQSFADSQDYLVKKTVSITDMVKDVNRALNNNNKSFYRVPSSDGMELQNVNEFIYELYGGNELERLISSDLTSARLTIFVKSSDSKIFYQFHDGLVSNIESIIPREYAYNITGMPYLGVKMYNSMAEIMSRSILLAITIISFMMILVFRSFTIGLISMIPNIFPVLFGLGFMGLSGIYLSHMTSMAGCIVIGLAVDDTIHFISRYRMEFASLGNYKKALDASIRGVGRALAITTIILVIGFGACMVSDLDAPFYMGLICITCFIAALLADFFIAPALILVFKPFGKEFVPPEDTEEKLEMGFEASIKN